MTQQFTALKSRRAVSLSFEIPVSRLSRFWEGLAQGKLLTTKCSRCGKLFFPPQSDCSGCLGSQMDWVELSGEAQIETYTQIVIRPSSFQKYEPYIVAVGKLKEGVKALAWLRGFKLAEIKVGMPVKLRPRISEEGVPIYEFVPP